jgi:hypothetical protein
VERNYIRILELDSLDRVKLFRRRPVAFPHPAGQWLRRICCASPVKYFRK